MENNTIIKTAITFLGSCLTLAVGGVDMIFNVLLFFLVTDYITGLMKARVKKETSSSVGWRGIMKKIGTLIAVIVAHQMDKIAPGDAMFRTAVITFFIANEGISILENLTVIGVPMPNIMTTALHIWKEESENGKGNK